MKKNSKGRPTVKSSKRLEEVLDLSSIDEHILSLANNLYFSLNKLEYSRRYTDQNFYLACLYLVHRKENCSLTMGELFHITKYNHLEVGDITSLKWEIMRLTKSITRDKGLTFKQTTPYDYLDQFCKKASLEFELSEEELKESSKEILDEYLTLRGELKGKPSSYACTSVYLAVSRYYTKEFTATEIKNVFGVDIQTLLKKKKELENVLMDIH